MSKAWKQLWVGIIVALALTGIIGILGGRLNSIDLLPDQGASWYYWKLPTKEFWPRLTAWSFYILHQVVIWILIWQAQFKDATKRDKKRWMILFVNLFFVLLHILQSHIWYDGLAQDVPVMSSQGSVIVMLILLLIMNNDRRGLFFGKKIPGFKDIKAFIMKYHGYFISWALIYTFWYHPTANTQGHLVGFFYMFLLFIQLSMIYTPVHTNKYWTFVLEVLVLFHGTAVALQQNNGMWPMFMFGFATMAVVTQIYGINLPKWARIVIQVIYLAGVIVVYGGITGIKPISMVHQVLWIPIIEYGLVFVFLFFGEGIIKLVKKIKK